MIILLGRYPRLQVSPFQHFEYTTSLSFGLQSFCREDSLVVLLLQVASVMSDPDSLVFDGFVFLHL